MDKKTQKLISIKMFDLGSEPRMQAYNFKIIDLHSGNRTCLDMLVLESDLFEVWRTQILSDNCCNTPGLQLRLVLDVIIRYFHC